MKRVMVSLALLLVSGGGMANNHTENRQFIHEQLQLDRQRFQSLQTPEFLKQTRPVAPQEQSFLDAQAQQFRQSMQPGERPVNAALVFVSFSMPAEELKQRVRMRHNSIFRWLSGEWLTAICGRRLMPLPVL